MLRRVVLVRTDVLEERSASIIRVFLHSVCRLLVTANIVPSLLILVTLMMEALRSSETKGSYNSHTV
jgi:cytochrome c oxidase subunit IV